MRFRLVESERAQHPLSLLCQVLGVTSAGYYAWRWRGPSLRLLGDAELKRRIVTIYDGSRQTYGAPRMTWVAVIHVDAPEDGTPVPVGVDTAGAF